MKLTKIIATVSDKRCQPDFLRQLYQAGMNVVRINSAHVSVDVFKQMVEAVRSVNKYIAVMIDTKGPEIRTTLLADGASSIEFKKGDEVQISGNPDCETSTTHIYVNYTGICNVLTPGSHFLIDDGTLDFEIISNEGTFCRAIAVNSGSLGSRKTVNIPGVDIDLPSVTDRDKEFIRAAAALHVDFIAHSFVRSSDDIRSVQSVLDSCGSDIKIIAKIENQQGIDNFDSILDSCYGIMIARGDLGIEVPAERIPGIQRMMISKCIAAHKPVIVATQMLHSMINNPRPTRAEVTDVAEAVYQQADAVMLSGETASGRYPIEAVSTMARIAQEVESTMAKSFNNAPPVPDAEITSFLARQAVMSETRVSTRAIVTDSFHGTAARYISSFRGKQPIFAICNRQVVLRRLALSYGIIPYYDEDYSPSQRYPIVAMRHIVENGALSLDDRIAYLGSLGGVVATFLEINRLGDIINDSSNNS